jgi:hypothetical protein
MKRLLLILLLSFCSLSQAATIIDIDHEVDLSEYDSTVTDGGDLSADAAAALASTSKGLNCLIDDTTSIYGQVSSASWPSGADADLRVRFYVDPNGLTMTSGDIFTIFAFYTNGAPWFLGFVEMRYDGASHELRLTAKEDDGTNHEDTEDISDAEHYVEVYFERASSDVAADGRCRWWIDGTLKQDFTSLDNYDAFVDIALARLGACVGLDAGTSGTFYLDQLKCNDDGAEIGAHSPPAGGAPQVIVIIMSGAFILCVRVKHGKGERVLQVDRNYSGDCSGRRWMDLERLSGEQQGQSGRSRE